MIKKRKCLLAIIMGILVFHLTGCGHVQSAESLIKAAKNKYGACKVVSKKESENKTEVVLHDKLQDFDYTVYSVMNDINIDGSSFGSVPHSSDTFEQELWEKVISNIKNQLDDICNKADMRYSVDDSTQSITIFAPSEKSGKEVALKCAILLQTQNQKNRLDGRLVEVVSDESKDQYSKNRYGSIKLPDMKWRTKEDEDIDEYTQMAREITDPKAEFVRMEKGRFSDTGAELDRVVNTLWEDYPQDMNSPVRFFYFKDSKGKEFYVCDFYYYDEDHYEYQLYTNYEN